ncbi:hypothetical protein WBP06_09525 [Novosphingobium sp. BL-8H]|uniref:DUF6950 family protein n=1 Tax=Novosphingobium sp. BL-8H TaxID=3127640 RepID=UPI00375725B8
MDIVDETLREWRSGVFVYGQSDCMLSIGRYLARTGHDDVTGQFLGRYDTHEGAAAEIKAHGGIAGLMALAGAVAKDAHPARGDVVEVVYSGEQETCGIGGLCTGDGVALRLDRGTIEVALRFITYRGVWHGSR